MSEIAKRLEKADRYLQKGKLSSALEEFREILLEDPNHDFARQRAADVCLQSGQDAEAAEHLGILFDLYANQGRSSEAVSTYRKLQKLGYPLSPGRTLQFAQFSEKTSPREALDAYQLAFQSFSKSGQNEEALKAIRKIVALEPTPEHLKSDIDLSVKLGKKTEAAASLLKLMQLEQKAGKDTLPLLERAHSLDSKNSAIILEYAQALLQAGNAEKAVQLLENSDAPELQETYFRALLAAGKPDRAEAVCVSLFEGDPKYLAEICEVISAYLHKGDGGPAAELARKIEPQVKARGDIRDYLTAIREVADQIKPPIEFLEYLAQLYNGSNREHEYCETLLKLFELYFANRNFVKAADCLERASEVDAYEPGHQEKLELLRGKVDDNRLNVIASRLRGVGKTKTTEEEEDEPAAASEPVAKQEAGEPTVLEDLMLQAEIFLQYAMRSKAVERLERINKLFPREEERREKLAQLYAAAGFTPKYEAPVKSAATGGKVVVSPGPDESAVDNFARVTEITRNIARQSSVKSVLFATVNDVGRHWNVSRCVAGLCAPGKAPSAAMEYCAPGVAKSDVMGLARLISNLQSQAVAAGGPISFEKAQNAPQLEALRAVLVSQKIVSLIAVPLVDREEPIGIVILEQCGTPRPFRPVDEVVLNTIAEQIVMAVNNARLRTLVKTLAVTEEKSGLLRRSSYLDVLLSEVQRGLAQKSAVTLMLMSFGSANVLLREVGEHVIDEVMQEIGQAIIGNIRQNDVAVRYDLTSIALILSDTNEKSAFFVLEKIRKVLTNTRMPGHAEPVSVTAGICELVMQSKFEPVDIVTEAINRVEHALELARHEGGNRAHAMAPALEATAVATK